MIAGVLFSLAFLPYFKSIFDGQKPNRAAWFIWSFVGLLILFSYKAGGADTTLWTAYVGAFAPLPIFFVSIWRGEGGFGKVDLISIAVALSGVALWWVTTNPILGLLIFLGVDMTGVAPIVNKLLKDPKSEDMSPWILWSLGNAANILAVEKWSWAEWYIPLYPICYLIGTMAINVLILRRYWHPRYS